MGVARDPLGSDLTDHSTIWRESGSGCPVDTDQRLERGEDIQVRLASSRDWETSLSHGDVRQFHQTVGATLCRIPLISWVGAEP